MLSPKALQTLTCIVLYFIQTKDSRSLLEKLTSLETAYNSETEKLKNDVERLRMSDEEAKNATNRALSLQEEITKLRKELHQTQSEKKKIEETAVIYKQETDQVSGFGPTSLDIRNCFQLHITVIDQTTVAQGHSVCLD